jgi:hypothetical protein
VNTHDHIHLDAALLASMIELLMVLLPDEYCEFLDSRDTEIFILELAYSYRRRQGQKGAPKCLNY